MYNYKKKIFQLRSNCWITDSSPVKLIFDKLDSFVQKFFFSQSQVHAIASLAGKGVAYPDKPLFQFLWKKIFA